MLLQALDDAFQTLNSASSIACHAACVTIGFNVVTKKKRKMKELE